MDGLIALHAEEILVSEGQKEMRCKCWHGEYEF